MPFVRTLQTIRRGDRGILVRLWQVFLRGEETYFAHADGIFGPLTEKATKHFQRRNNLKDDGIVGNCTWGMAMREGFEVVPADPDDELGPLFPPRPTDLKPISPIERARTYGSIKYRPAPTTKNPERIIITNGWAQSHLKRVTIPQLKAVPGAPQSGRVWVHDREVDGFRQLFKAWDDAGLVGLIHSCGGFWCARFTRGSRSNLSNHSWGTAVDLNVPWNYLGHQPALVDEYGSLRKLVPIANELGWWWGGHGWPPSFELLDGMHFEKAGKRR